MASFNKVIIAGNLTRDVELRYTPSGTPVTDIGLAVNDRRKGQNGEYIDEVSFIDVTMWSRTAEVAAEYLSKGANVMIEGRLKQESWEKDGQKHYKIKVICERLVMLGKKSDSEGSSYSRPSQPESPAGANYSNDYPDSDIPF